MHYIGGEMEIENTLSNDNLEKSFPFPDDKYIFYSSGRTALKYILKAINPSYPILLPSYLCESILQPFKELDIEYEFYRIKEAREALQNGNAEEVIEHCEVVIDKISNDDAVALDAVGFDNSKLISFEGFVSVLRELNREQVHKMNERQDVKAIESVLFDELEEFVRKVSSIGKAMYTYKEKQRYDDFSVTHILSQINHGRKKQKDDDDGGETAPVYDVMIGRVTDKITDLPLEDAVVRLEGTEIMVDTDEEGEFYLDEIPSGVYTISFSKRGYVVGEQHNVEVGTSEMVDLRVELLPEEGRNE
jgi:hypothetical protein